RPDLSDRIGNSLLSDVGRRAMHRLKHRRKFALWIEIGRCSDADGADYRRAEVREDIAEKIRADDHIEPIGMTHEVCGKNVDMVLIAADVGVIPSDFAKTFIPEWHGVDDSVGFGGRGEVLLAAAG